MAFNWDPEGEWYERAKEISERALQLDPQIPEGHYIRARLAWTPQRGFQHDLAIREVVAALAERPNLFEGFDWLGTILWHVGLIEDARLNYKRALAISPRDMLARMHVVSCEFRFTFDPDHRASRSPRDADGRRARNCGPRLLDHCKSASPPASSPT